MRKTVISFLLAGSLFISGCSLITLESSAESSVTEETGISKEVITSETTIEETKVAETTNATEQTTETIKETEAPAETTVPEQTNASGKVIILATGGTIAGSGDAGKSTGYIDVINDLKIPVVISSRIGDGIIIPSNLLCEGTIAADNLPPQKAAVLLRLALTKTSDTEKIQEMFFKY